MSVIMLMMTGAAAFEFEMAGASTATSWYLRGACTYSRDTWHDKDHVSCAQALRQCSSLGAAAAGPAPAGTGRPLVLAWRIHLFP